MQKPSRRVLVGETPEEEAARFWARDRRPSPDTIRAWQTEAGLEQRTLHSAFGAGRRRRNRQEGHEEELDARGLHGTASEILMVI